jgi:hypothetical protein
MHFSDFIAGQPLDVHRRLVLAVTTGLHETRLAADVIQQDGDVESLRECVSTAITWLEEARGLLGDA